MTEAVHTASVMLQTLCVPCANRCAYCLLSWDGKTYGACFDRSAKTARRFAEWIARERPGCSFQFYFGYSMDHPHLAEAIDLLNELGSTQGRFLQMDGFAFRSEAESLRLLTEFRQHGVEEMNFTFYGLEAYHDRFAGRKGDFLFLSQLARQAAGLGFRVSARIPLMKTNAAQADGLADNLQRCGVAQTHLFVPHSEGRGAGLERIRLDSESLALVSPARRTLLSGTYRQERDWLSEKDPPLPKRRALLVSLTQENIDGIELAPVEETLGAIERLDEDYYAAFPDFAELAQRYGRKDSSSYYSLRDLWHRYRMLYQRESGLTVYDVTDERRHGSRRY